MFHSLCLSKSKKVCSLLKGEARKFIILSFVFGPKCLMTSKKRGIASVFWNAAFKQTSTNTGIHRPTLSDLQTLPVHLTLAFDWTWPWIPRWTWTLEPFPIQISNPKQQLDSFSSPFWVSWTLCLLFSVCHSHYSRNCFHFFWLLSDFILCEAKDPSGWTCGTFPWVLRSSFPASVLPVDRLPSAWQTLSGKHMIPVSISSN